MGADKIIGVSVSAISKIDNTAIGDIASITGETVSATSPDWITKWTVGAGQTITLWSQQGTVSYNYDVDWGDGNTEASITASDKTHDYSAAGAGTYTVTITGQFGGLNMQRGSAADRSALVEFVNWGTSVISGIYRQFYYCNNMVYSATDAPDLTNLTATSGTLIRDLFSGCTTITDVDLSGWSNTGNFTGTAYRMFYNATGLLSVNLTGWDPSNITSTQDMFYNTGSSGIGCVFTLPNLDFSSATTMLQMFYNAKISSIDVSDWTLRSAGVVASYLFYGIDENDAADAFNIDLSGWTNTSGITTLARAFYYSDATVINLTGWDTSNVTSFGYTFYQNSNLTHITGLNELSAAANTTTMAQMFDNCRNLGFNDADTTNFGGNWGTNLGNTTSFISMFSDVGADTPGANPPNVADWDMSGATDINNMFNNTEWTTGSLDVSSWDISNVTGAGLVSLFYNNNSGTTIDTSNWEIDSSITSMAGFLRNSAATAIDFSDANCDFSNVTTFSHFGYAASFTRFILHASSDFSSVTGAAFSNFFPTSGYATVATSDYDALLLRLDAGGQSSVTLFVGSSTYTGGGAVATARANLITKSWTITDGGIAP